MFAVSLNSVKKPKNSNRSPPAFSSTQPDSFDVKRTLSIQHESNEDSSSPKDVKRALSWQQNLEMVQMSADKGINGSDALSPKSNDSRDNVLARPSFSSVHPNGIFSNSVYPEPSTSTNQDVPFRRTFAARLFIFLDNPTSSSYARYFAFFMIVIILLSIVTFIVQTLPGFHPQGKDLGWNDPSGRAFIIIDYFSIFVFTLEYVLRLLTVSAFYRSQRRLLLMKNPLLDLPNLPACFILGSYAIDLLNLVDFFSVAPFYISIVLSPPDHSDSNGNNSGRVSSLFVVLRVLRLARLLRLFKFGKYSQSLQLFIRVLKLSKDALVLLLLFITVSCVIFGSLIYYCESGSYDKATGKYLRPNILGDGEEESPFTSIPAAFYWVIVTMATVGFGDQVPTTPLGKLVACIAIYFGMLGLALPISVVSSHFSGEYAQKMAEKEEERLKKLEDQQRKEWAEQEARLMALQQQQQQIFDHQQRQLIHHHNPESHLHSPSVSLSEVHSQGIPNNFPVKQLTSSSSASTDASPALPQFLTPQQALEQQDAQHASTLSMPSAVKIPSAFNRLNPFRPLTKMSSKSQLFQAVRKSSTIATSPISPSSATPQPATLNPTTCSCPCTCNGRQPLSQDERAELVQLRQLVQHISSLLSPHPSSFANTQEVK